MMPLASRSSSKSASRTCMFIVIQQGASEPVVRNAAPISWEILEAYEPVEMVDRKMRDGFRLGEPNIDCDATPAVFVCFNAPPIRYATADGAKVKLDRFPPHVVLGTARDVDSFAFEVVNPQHAVPTTDGAIARRGRLRHTFEAPSHRTT